MDLGVRAGDDGEADVAFAAMPHEAGAPGRIGAHLDGPSHECRVVTDTVPDGDVVGQLCHRSIQHSDVIGDRVRPRVAGTQQFGKALAGGVGEAVDR